MVLPQAASEYKIATARGVNFAQFKLISQRNKCKIRVTLF